MELRPCFDGFAGIPQETRVLFSSFHELEGIDPVGLVLHPSKRLARTVPRLQSKASSDMGGVGRLIISSEELEPGTPLDRFRIASDRYREVSSLLVTTGLNRKLRPTTIDTREFTDYFWRRLFSKGLGTDELDRIRTANFAAIRPSWLSLHSMGGTGRYPRMDTTGIDIFIAHTPWPTRVSPETQLVVRYHDAIPVFHPHQIKYPAMHHRHHRRALQSNQKSGIFVCVSEATRQDLLKLSPNLENRSTVIPTSVSSDFYPEPAQPAVVADVIRSHLQPGKAPKKRQQQNLQYLLMVSTVEPRKNHLALIGAWEKARRSLPDLKLVIVGSLGWNHGPIEQRMKKWRQRGDLYHLAGVPAGDLRLIYSNAMAVVCPSVAEGFDMSGIEAMMCGTPVLASDIPVHRENYQRAALYFNPYSTDELADVITEFVDSPHWSERRNAAGNAGLSQAQGFQRPELASRWGDFFEDVARGRYGPARRKR